MNNQNLNIRISQSDLDQAKEKAKAAGFDSVSQWIRWLIRNA